MSNEIDFEEFIRNIDCAIYEKIDVDNWNISIEVVLDVVEFLQQSLEDLRTYIVNHPFSSKEEEIYFFKHIKPEVLSRLLYFTEIYNTEMRKPHGSIEVLKKYLERPNNQNQSEISNHKPLIVNTFQDLTHFGCFLMLPKFPHIFETYF